MRASKIGKGWRINGHDLSTFMENDSYEKHISGKEPKRSVIASSVIDIFVDRKEDAVRIMNTLAASLNSKPSEYGPSTMQSQYVERENMVRITLSKTIWIY